MDYHLHREEETALQGVETKVGLQGRHAMETGEVALQTFSSLMPDPLQTKQVHQFTRRLFMSLQALKYDQIEWIRLRWHY